MSQPEFTALQVTVLVRTEPGKGHLVQTYFDDVSFQYQLQDVLGQKMKELLRAEGLDFEEVIISLDAPAQKAGHTRTKSSLMGRLFGEK